MSLIKGLCLRCISCQLNFDFRGKLSVKFCIAQKKYPLRSYKLNILRRSLIYYLFKLQPEWDVGVGLYKTLYTLLYPIYLKNVLGVFIDDLLTWTLHIY